MKHFRVDKMDAASVVLTEREGQEAYEAITDIDNYSSYTFSMHGGDVKNVTLVFINHIIDSIIDRFGSDVLVSYHDETHSIFSSIGFTSVHPKRKMRRAPCPRS